MLGQDLMARLAGAGEPAVGLDRSALDITDPAAVRDAIATHRPAVVVNCAAWTAVDDAEAREPEALRINGGGTAHLARACAETGARMLQLSTDYVFGGDADRADTASADTASADTASGDTASPHAASLHAARRSTGRPYREDEKTDPRTAYGRTKLAGEHAVREALPDTGYVVRTAWLYGAGGANFVRTMIKLEGLKDTLDVVDDQHGQPTWTVDLADRLVRLGLGAIAGSAPAGIYHGTSAGDGTWCDLAREVFRLLGADPARVQPTTSAAYVRPAPRPAYSVLGHDRWRVAGIEPIRDWQSALAAAFPALVAAERG
jgi:dTDP-4-dehydrorhamnose reductase